MTPTPGVVPQLQRIDLTQPPMAAAWGAIEPQGAQLQDCGTWNGSDRGFDGLWGVAGSLMWGGGPRVAAWDGRRPSGESAPIAGFSRRVGRGWGATLREGARATCAAACGVVVTMGEAWRFPYGVFDGARRVHLK